MKTKLIDIALFTKKSINTYIDGVIDIIGYSKESLSKEIPSPMHIDEDKKGDSMIEDIGIKIEAKKPEFITESQPIFYNIVSNDGLYTIDLNKNTINDIVFPIEFIKLYCTKTKDANARANQFGYFVSKILRHPTPQLLVSEIFKHDYKTDYLGNILFDSIYMTVTSIPNGISKISKAYINPKYLNINNKGLIVDFNNIKFED